MADAGAATASEVGASPMLSPTAQAQHQQQQALPVPVGLAEAGGDDAHGQEALGSPWAPAGMQHHALSHSHFTSRPSVDPRPVPVPADELAAGLARSFSMAAGAGAPSTPHSMAGAQACGHAMGAAGAQAHTSTGGASLPPLQPAVSSELPDGVDGTGLGLQPAAPAALVMAPCMHGPKAAMEILDFLIELVKKRDPDLSPELTEESVVFAFEMVQAGA
jgi:hypothetical protein